jgi:hypothetical protein
MGTLRLSKPNDPMYSEGPQSYSPHWGRAFLPKPKQRSEAEKLMKDLTEYCAEQKAGRVGGAHLRRIHRRTTET